MILKGKEGKSWSFNEKNGVMKMYRGFEMHPIRQKIPTFLNVFILHAKISKVTTQTKHGLRMKTVQAQANR